MSAVQSEQSTAEQRCNGSDGEYRESRAHRVGLVTGCESNERVTGTGVNDRSMENNQPVHKISDSNTNPIETETDGVQQVSTESSERERETQELTQANNIQQTITKK